MLEVRGLRAGYGAIHVLRDATLEIATGRVTAILGPNGVGKTTLLRAIMGLIAPVAGDVLLDGESVRALSTWERVTRGLALVPEGRLVFRDMSVEDNLRLGAYPRARRSLVGRNLERSYTLFPVLRNRRSQLAGSLSGGEAQMLAIARGLMSDPRILLVDEPSLGLAPVVVRELFATLAALKAEGRTLVLVEQNTRLAVQSADHVVLLRDGRVVLAQPAAEVDLERLHDLYFAR